MTEMIEKNNKVTGAQGLHMIRQWQSSRHAPLQLYAAPKSVKLKHRARKPLPLLDRDDCNAATKQFKDVAYDQVEERHFTKTPSKWRMVQLYVSKQAPIEGCIPQGWVPTAKAFYVRALREAAKMACHEPTRINKSTKHGGTKSSKLSHHSPLNLFASPNDGPRSTCNATADATDDPDDSVSAESKSGHGLHYRRRRWCWIETA